jgi:hypothetical protein
MPLTRTLLALLLLLLALPSVAVASTTQESLFQDDAALIFSTYDRREQTLDELKALGVDTIRTNVLWNWVAPKPNSKRRPHFDATNPARYDWFRWDRLVEGAAARGIAVQLTLTGPIPSWASACKSRRHTCRPKANEFGRFVEAAAKHYPSVSRWSIWNEPNQAGWLYPQRTLRGRRLEAARMYRTLAYEGIAALRSNGHARDMILLGETAPLGRRFGTAAKLNIPPAAFWRAVLCIDRRGKRLGGRARKLQGCPKRFKQLKVTGAAHHPYTRGGAGSPTSLVARDDVTLGSLGRLTQVIDRARHWRRVPSRLPIYLTEYGFQTNPPDRYSGVSPSLAAVWLNQSDWIAFNNRRVQAVAQYELRDERSLAAFQTGLRFKDGRAKPGLAAYRMPLWVQRSRSGRSTIWGQLRAGGRGDRVDVLMQPRRGRAWRKFKTVRVSNSRGYFRVVTRRNAYRWRLRWGKQYSRAALPAFR